MACGTTISTPEKDAQKITNKFKKASTPNDIEKVRQLFQEYTNAYDKAVNDGKCSMEDYRKFMELCRDNM